MTFAEASAQYVELRKSDWRSEKTIYRWEMFLQRCGSSLMPMDCKDIRREDVEAALRGEKEITLQGGKVTLNSFLPARSLQ